MGFIPGACDYTNDGVQIKDLQTLKPDSGLWTNQHVGQMLFVVLSRSCVTSWEVIKMWTWMDIKLIYKLDIKLIYKLIYF